MHIKELQDNRKTQQVDIRPELIGLKIDKQAKYPYFISISSKLQGNKNSLCKIVTLLETVMAQ
jgi:hypothetical protein